MARLRLILILAALLIGTGVQAQEIRYRVFYWIDERGTYTSDSALSTLQPLAQAVRAYDIELDFEQVDAFINPYSVLPADVIGFISFYEGDFALIPIFVPFYEISPVLEPDGPWLGGLQDNFERAIPALVFATGRCDLVMLHINKWAAQDERRPYKVDGDFFRGSCALMAGDYEQAADYLTSSPNLPYFSFRSDVNTAWLHIQLGNHEAAFTLIDAALAEVVERSNDYLPGTVPYYLMKRSQLHALAFDYDAAIEDMNEAIDVAAKDRETPDSLFAELYTERGQRILLLYEWDRVLADYNRALEHDPTYAPAYFHRGVLFYTQGPRENALPDFARYLELAPDGEFAGEAAQYIGDIEAELAVLEGEG